MRHSAHLALNPTRPNNNPFLEARIEPSIRSSAPECGKLSAVASDSRPARSFYPPQILGKYRAPHITLVDMPRETSPVPNVLTGLAPPLAFKLYLKLALVALSASLAGYIDLICIVRFKNFAGFMTGNLLNFGVAVASGEPIDILFFSTIVLTNFFGTFFY